AIVRVQIDKRRERRDRHKHDIPWHEYASVDREVDRTEANPRPLHVARAEHRLLQRCLLLGRHALAGHGLGGRTLRLRLVAGLALGVGPGVGARRSRALALSRGVALGVGASGHAFLRILVLRGRVGLVATLLTTLPFGLARLVAIAAALADGLVLLLAG